MPDVPLQALPHGDSLALFRRLFSHSGDAALLTRPNGVFLAANAAACAVFRISEADLLERSREGGHRTLTDAADARLHAATIACARDGSACAEIRMRRVDGELFDAEVSSVRFLDEGAEPTLLMTLRDLSGQRGAEREVQTLEARLRFALDSAGIGDWDMDLRTNVARRSLRHDQCFGYTEAVPTWGYDTFLAHVHAGDRERVDAAFRGAMSGDSDYDTEFRTLWADGSLHWLSTKGRFYLDEAGVPCRVAGIVADISARRRAADALDAFGEQALRHERMLTSALAAMQDFAHIYDLDGRFLFVNQPLLDLWQMKLEQVVGRNFAEIGYPPELAARLQAQIREVVAGKCSITGETPYTGAAGVLGWYEYIFSPVLGADGRVDFVVGTTRDVTERMRNAQALAESAAEFRILAESMPQIVWVTRPDGWHVHFNQHWMDYTGLSLEASLGHGWNPPFHPEDRERAAARWRQATDSGEPYEIEYRLRRADGIYHWMLGRALPLRDASGTIVKWFGTCTDIEELKQAQLHIGQSNRALLDSEQRYRSLFEQNTDGVYSLDLAGRIVSANQAFLSLCGYAAEDVLSMEFLHYVAPECVASSAAHLQRALAGEPVHYESVRVHRDGRRIDVELNYQPLLVDGAIAGVHGIVRDITQRKRATELLHRQQEFLAALIENVTDGIVACDADGSVTLSNRAVRDFRAREFEPVGSVSRFEPLALYLADGSTPLLPAQMPWMRALHDGSVRDAEVLLVPAVGPSRRLVASGQALYDAGGRKTGAVVAMRDITAERMAQDAIRTQAHMLDSIGQAVIATDLAGTVTYLNRFAEGLYGWTSQEALGRNVVDITSSDASRLAGQDVLAQLRSGAAWRGEFRAHRRAGTEFTAAVTVALLRDRDGTAIGLVGVSEDISKRQQIQEALSRQNALLANAQRVAEMGVWELDVPTRHLVWSSETHRIFGVAADAFDNTFEAFFAFVHPDDACRMRALYDAPLKLCASLEVEYRIRRPDGEERVVFERGEVVCDDAGRAVRKSGVVMDVTERRREQDALRELNAGLEARVLARTNELDHVNRTLALEVAERTSMLADLKLSEERFRALTALSADWFWEQDADLRFVQISSGESDLGGLPVEAHVGALRWELPHTEIVGGDWGPHKALLAARLPFRDLLLERSCPEGRRYVIASGTPRYAPDGSFAGYLGIGRDVTQAKRAELALSVARDAAEQGSRAKSEFLATMSHEIRTPMNGVVGMIDVLAQTRLKPEQLETLDIARESAYALLAIIDDVLDFSKIEAGQFQIEAEPISVAAVVESVCDTLQSVARKSKVNLTLFTDPSLPPRVRGDAGRLRQVLLNLAGNAIKFSSSKERSGRVSVRATQIETDVGQRQLELSVVDDGIGMDEAMQSRLFVPFTQADSSTTRRFGGTGLGLSISHALVEMMGGTMAVRSAPGTGSTFTVRLPLEALHASAAGDADALDFAGLRCLLPGGSDGQADDFRAYLVHAGATVERVPDVASACAWLRDCPPMILVVVIASADAASQGRALSDLRAACSLRPRLDVRFVVVERGQYPQRGVVTGDLIVLSRDVVHRADVLRAVGQAAGRPEAPQVDISGFGADTAPMPLTPLPSGPGSPLILVAEDNEINQIVLRKQLALLGFTAHIARNGPEALQHLRQRDYGLLLTDLHMPDMNGFELARAVRDVEPGVTRMPIVAITANAMKGEGQRCLASGMDDCMTKPVQLSELKAMLAKWLPGMSGEAA